MSIKQKYNLAKAAKVGSECTCPSCGTKFVKGNYQQAFCKSKGGTVCKDKYWNTVTPTKRNNTTRISPASARWMANKDVPIVSGYGKSQRKIDKEDLQAIEIEFDGGWDSHDSNIGRCEWCNCFICRCEN